jgi:serpin B
MHRLKILAIAGLCAASVASAPGLIQASPETGDWAPLIGGYNRTGQRLFQALAKDPGNIVFSPYSIGTAMAMALAGAHGETEAEMARALGLGIPVSEIDTANAALLASLNDAAMESIQLRAADGVMLTKQGGGVSDDYVAVLRKDYAADVFPGTDVATLNAWVKRRTAGKIDSILNHLDPTTTMVLIDAIYFKAPWQKAFDVQATRAETFHAPGDEAQVLMMHMENYFHVASRPGYRAIELPYAGERVSMVVILPDDSAPAGIVQRLDGDEMRQLLAALHTPLHRVNLSLPRFKSSFEASLTQPFWQMGMHLAFDLHAADFSGVTGRPPGLAPLAIGQIVHRAMIDVTEQGTEAAAATGVGTFTSRLQQLETFRVDRPFLFAIVDSETNAILFEGRIDDPRQAS